MKTTLFAIVASLIFFTIAASAETRNLSMGEVCEITEEMNIGGGEEYTKGDRKALVKICSFDVHSDPSADIKDVRRAMAVCPKMNSTFPGVNFMKISKKKTREQVEAGCNPTVGGKNSGVRGKFKYSTSGTKNASILGYFHVSRALGMKVVPPAAFRTLDREFHLSVAEKAVSFAHGNNEIISRGWRKLYTMIAEMDPAITSPDGNYTIGVLSKNPTNEQKTYDGIWLGGDNQDERMQNFMNRSSSTYQQLKKRKPISDFVGTAFTSENYTAIQQMKDVSDMIILDTLFGQRDRFGNTHSVYNWLTVHAGGAVKKFSIDDVEEMISEDAKQGLPGMDLVLQKFEQAEDMPKNWRKEIRPRLKKIRQVVEGYLSSKGFRVAFAENLMLKDNDAGFKSRNPFLNNGVIRGVYHVSPETYEQLMKLYQTVIVDGTMDGFLSQSLMMSGSDREKFKEALEFVVEDLRSKDESGQLFKDLHVKSHLSL